MGQDGIQIAAATAGAGAAHADLYPKFVITGLAGRQSADVGGLTLGGGNYFSIGPAITLPIFNYGRIRAQIAAQEAQLDEAQRQYEEEVLAAFEEAENAFVAHDRSASRGAELLDAQRQVFQTERDLTANRFEILRNTVALFKALGD